MHSRDPRHVTAVPVEVAHGGRSFRAITEDLSSHGACVRTAQSARVGDLINVVLSLPSGDDVILRARVAYVLPEAPARALGRSPGWGCQFLDEADPALSAHLADVSQRSKSALGGTTARVLLVEPGQPLAARIRAGLEPFGVAVTAHALAAKAYAACLEEVPDALVVSTALEGLDTWTLMQMLSGHPRVAGIPVLLISDEAGDMVRLRAFRLGAEDFIEKPFTDEELALRLRRTLARRDAGRSDAGLHGSLADVGVAMALLALMELERKSGVLALVSGGSEARLHVSEGRLLRATNSAGGTPAEVLAAVLKWTSGRFDLHPGCDDRHDDFGDSITHLLLLHAQLADEADDDAPESGR